MGPDDRADGPLLAAHGYDAVYVPEVAHHHPSPVRDVRRRRATDVRNAIWTAWLRRPANIAARITAAQVRKATSDGASRAGLVVAACRGMPWVLRERPSIPAQVERDLRIIERGTGAVLQTRQLPVGVGGP